MNVTVKLFKGNLAAVEYADQQGMLQRKWIPRQFLDTSKKGPATLSEDVLIYGIEYSTVHLTELLGEYVGLTSIATLQNELRKAGLWLREDYRQNPQLVDIVVRRMRLGRELDTTTVLNAAMHYGG